MELFTGEQLTSLTDEELSAMLAQLEGERTRRAVPGGGAGHGNDLPGEAQTAG